MLGMSVAVQSDSRNIKVNNHFEMNPWSRRFLWNCGLVVGALLLTLLVGTLSQAMWAGWSLPALVADAMAPRANIDLTEWPRSLLGLFLTVGLLALAAKSRIASIVVVLWFILNAIGMFLLSRVAFH
jgi:hypothetical protein